MSVINEPYNKLLKHFKKIKHLEEAYELLCWDQETKMPIKATSSRAQQLATLEEVIYERKLEPNIPRWIENAYSKGKLTNVQSSNLSEALRIYEETSKVPKQLCGELVEKIAMAQKRHTKQAI